jgi:alpha-tubulin suppressor-like RCC1 family protein
MVLRVMLPLLLGVTVIACTGRRDDGSRGGRDLGAASSKVRSAAPAPEGGSSAGAERIVSLALGDLHTCVLLGSGEVRCWGKREKLTAPQEPPGNLGSNGTAAAAVPEKLGAKALRISAGGNESCAVLEDGRVRCWQPAYPNYDVREAVLGRGVTDLTSGQEHSCALTTAGKVRCWGSSHYGQLGYGSREGSGLRKELGDVPAGGKVIQVAAGTRRTCALFESRTFRCWGDDPGPTAYSDVAAAMKARPAGEYPLVNLGTPVTQIASGGSTCALLAGGTVRCWGENEAGELGYGHKRAVDDPTLAEDVRVGGPVVQIATGLGHICVLLQQGRVRCWGHASSGALGYGNGLDIGDDEAPESAGDVPVGGKVVQIAAGGFHTCALLDTGKVRCWGDGSWGQLGYGAIQRVGANETPADVGDVPLFPRDPRPTRPGPSKALSAGKGHGPASNARPREAPFTWEEAADGSPPPEARTCTTACRQCKVLFDGTVDRQALLEQKPRSLSATEQELLRTAYTQYLNAPACAHEDGSPLMDPRAIGTAQDPGRVDAVLDGAFTHPGRKQTLIAFFAGHCGSDGKGKPGSVEHLTILVEGKELLRTRVGNDWERLRAVDLDRDHVSEVVAWSHETRFVPGGSWLEVVSFAGGSERFLGWFASNDNSCGEQVLHLSYGHDRADHRLCFLAKYLQIPCAPTP